MNSRKDFLEEPDHFHERIGRNVRELRLSLKLTQKEVCCRAQLLGFDYTDSMLSRIETGAKRTSTFDLIALAQIFGVTVERILMGGEEEK